MSNYAIQKFDETSLIPSLGELPLKYREGFQNGYTSAEPEEIDRADSGMSVYNLGLNPEELALIEGLKKKIAQM